jgi:cephalosporin-C deacetylase-like acetyl esterase
MSGEIRIQCAFLSTLFMALLTDRAARAGDPPEGSKPETVLDGTVFTDPADRRRMAEMWGKDVRQRRIAANNRETDAWRNVRTQKDWQAFRDTRIEALRRSLGVAPEPPADLKIAVSGAVRGAGYKIENLIFESRPGLLVTANLYSPAEARDAMPGILICHSHHNPKSQSELQEMGVLWARAGCLVLVMDQLGHGERRQHPFRSKEDFAGDFRPSRQDYYFRYNTGMQLAVVGESLIGWMTWDLMRGVDLLLGRPGIDPARIILLGAVAGGGDPSAVTAALDPRISCVVPFNFGGPQPETIFPLPEDAEKSFNYFGGGSWESTRNLRLSARDAFAPWVIVGSVAPRRLVYAHEFAWDQEHDPVWRRLQTIFGLYDSQRENGSPSDASAPAKLASTHGSGSVRGTGPENTHCNNIGPVHLVAIHAAFERWFRIPVPKREDLPRHTAEELTCLTPAIAADRPMRPLYEMAREIGAQRAAAARERLAKLSPVERRAELRRNWERLVGAVAPKSEAKVLVTHASAGGLTSPARQERVEAKVERLALEVEPGIVVPLVLLAPAKLAAGKRPVVVGVAQAGKQAFLDHQAGAIAELLEAGVAVCLPDVRGTGETKPDNGRGRNSSATGLSSSELMLGETAVGARVRDLRSVVSYVRARPEFNGQRVALWGDSFAARNPRDANLAIPLDAADSLPLAEPLGAFVVLLTALFEDDIHAVSARGGFPGFQWLLHSPFLYLPHDVVVPGALTAGDLCDIVAALTPRPVQLAELVDGANRPLTAEETAVAFAQVNETYGPEAASGLLMMGSLTEPASKFLVQVLRE